MPVDIFWILGNFEDLKLQPQNLKDKKYKYNIFRICDAYGCGHSAVPITHTSLRRVCPLGRYDAV
jgi:hypothetical protein